MSPHTLFKVVTLEIRIWQDTHDNSYYVANVYLDGRPIGRLDRDSGNQTHAASAALVFLEQRGYTRNPDNLTLREWARIEGVEVFASWAHVQRKKDLWVMPQKLSPERGKILITPQTFEFTKWIVAPEDQGQIVEIAYSQGYAEMAFRRIIDRSNGSIRYQFADFEWFGTWPERWEPWNCAPSLPSGVPWEDWTDPRQDAALERWTATQSR